MIIIDVVTSFYYRLPDMSASGSISSHHASHIPPVLDKQMPLLMGQVVLKLQFMLVLIYLIVNSLNILTSLRPNLHSSSCP